MKNAPPGIHRNPKSLMQRELPQQTPSLTRQFNEKTRGYGREQQHTISTTSHQESLNRGYLQTTHSTLKRQKNLVDTGAR